MSVVWLTQLAVELTFSFSSEQEQLNVNRAAWRFIQADLPRPECHVCEGCEMFFIPFVGQHRNILDRLQKRNLRYSSKYVETNSFSCLMIPPLPFCPFSRNVKNLRFLNPAYGFGT